MKKSRYIVLFVIFLILMDWVRYDLIRFVDNIGFNILIGIVIFALGICYLVALVMSLIHFVRFFKHDKKSACTPILLLSIVFIYYVVINNSRMYAKLDYSINKEHREEIIQMYSQGGLEQIGDNKYIVPYRLASHNKIAYIYEQPEKIAIFYISNGFQEDRVFIYAENEILDDDLDFYIWEFEDVRRLDQNWYYATVEHD